MKKTIALFAALAIAAVAMPSKALAQDSFEASLGADVVSRYVWRGMEQGQGVAIQPSLGFSYKGISLSAWGSTSVSELEAKEFDISLGYEIGGFSACFTDYFWAGEEAKYGHYTDDHYYELALAYNFGEKVPLTISWATMLFCGESDELDEDGDRMYSSYFNVAYDFDIQGVAVTPAIGFNPWKSQFDDDFSIMDITITAAKEINITDSFSLPVFAQVVVSPACDKTYLVFGLTF